MNKLDVKATGRAEGREIALVNARVVLEDRLKKKNPSEHTPLDAIVSEALWAEREHYRFLPPLDLFAKEINESHDPEGLWEAYNEGVAWGVEEGAREFLLGES